VERKRLRNVSVALFRMPATWVAEQCLESGGLSSTCPCWLSLPYGIISGAAVLLKTDRSSLNGIVKTFGNVNE
jgi:hypothetical protein